MSSCTPARTAPAAAPAGAAPALATAKGAAGSAGLPWAGIAAAAIILAASAAAALPWADAAPGGDGPAVLAGISPAGPLADPCDAAQAAPASAGPNPKLDAEMNARLDSLHGQITGIMAEYGFAYKVPHLSDEEVAEMQGRLDEAAAAYAHMFDEAAALADYGHGDGFPPQAAIAAIDVLIKGEQDEIMREYGYVIMEPRLSAEDEAAMNGRIDAVWAEMDAVIEAYDRVRAAQAAPAPGCEPGQDAADAEIRRLIEPLLDEIDAIMAEYGFVNELPDMSDAEMRLFNAEMAELAARHARAVKELAWRLAPMLADGSISMAEALEEDRRLSERADAEHHEALAEHGFVIVVPELSAEDEEAMSERLRRVHEKIDAVYGGVASDW